MNSYRKAFIYVGAIYAGLLQETDAGYAFSYDPGYLAMKDAAAVSLTLPLTDKTYESKTLFPFFDGLIPEGWLLDVVIRNWKCDARDRFGLLLVACKDPIGKVRIMGEKE